MKYDDDPLDEVIRRALSELEVPPPAPREAMWARIEAQRNRSAVVPARSADPVATSATTASGAVIDIRRRRKTWVQAGAGLAAMLVIGIGLGRMSLQQVESPAAQQTDVAGAAGESTVPVAYRLAASQHMQRTETLLASLEVDAGIGGAAEVSSWAQELLTDTRMLLASPAAADPATSRLLMDLELVLSQIVMIPSSRATEEVELIRDGLNESDVLLRLRAATAGPRLVGT